MSQFFSTKYKQGALDFSLFLLRLAGGGLMIKHGFDKLIHFNDKVRTFPDPLHVGSTISLSLVIFAEFFCAVLLVFGLLTRLAAIPLVICFSIALFVIHHGQVWGDGESSALFLAVYLALLFTGPGKFSLDRLIGK
jgi:putative oxidoreductase